MGYPWYFADGASMKSNKLFENIYKCSAKEITFPERKNRLTKNKRTY